MKQTFYLLLTTVLLSTFTFTACKKDETPDPTPTTPTACNGKNLCFKIDGTEENYDAQWTDIPAVGSNPARYRILWEEGSGNTYKNIEMDIYGNAVGTYTVTSTNPHAANDGGFQYFTASDNKNIQGQSGTIEITSINNNTLTGKFTITATDGNGTTYQITEGNFVNVPKK